MMTQRTQSVKEIYKILKKIRRYIQDKSEEENLDSDCGGMCARASAIIFAVLRHMGYRPRIMMAFAGHCFVICGINQDNYIIDITATQFSGKYEKIIFKKLFKFKPVIGTEEYYGFDNHKKYLLIKRNIYSLIGQQKKDDWPEEQIVSIEEVRDFMEKYTPNLL